MYGNAKTGVYKPRNTAKYVGDHMPVFRSSWQLKAFASLDMNDRIIKWGSESVVIPYLDSVRGNTPHRYFVDLFFQVADGSGRTQKWLIEIKPYSQSVPPKVTKRKSAAKLLMEQAVVQTNHCKWQAAVQFCKSRGWHFGVWTQKGINQLA